MLSWNSFSQTDTTKTALPNKILREVAKDLIRYDGCKEEVRLLNFKIDKLTEREIQKDTIINLLEYKDNTNKFIITKKDEQIKLSQDLTNNLNKELKVQKTKTFLWKLGTFLGVITTTYLIIIK